MRKKRSSLKKGRPGSERLPEGVTSSIGMGTGTDPMIKRIGVSSFGGQSNRVIREISDLRVIFGPKEISSHRGIIIRDRVVRAPRVIKDSGNKCYSRVIVLPYLSWRDPHLSDQ